MSEHVVHTAVLADSIRLIGAAEGADGAFRRVLQEFSYFAFRGCVTVSGDQFSFRLLEGLKGRELSRRDKAELAFTLGWVSHRACDRIMKPIWKEAPFKGRGTDVDPNVSPFECSIYHEAEAYRRFFSGNGTYTDALFPNRLAEGMPAGFDQAAAEKLVEGAMAANLMQIQTLRDGGDDQKWFEEICMRIQKFYVGLHRYRRAITEPDPVNYREFVSGINWYGEEDPILQAAETLRRGGELAPGEAEARIREGGESYYAKALALSMRYMLAAERYIRDPGLDTAWLREQLDIGKLGPGGLAV